MKKKKKTHVTSFLTLGETENALHVRLESDAYTTGWGWEVDCTFVCVCQFDR